MQISEEIFQNILEQPDPVDLSRLTPYCSDFTLDAFSQYRKHVNYPLSKANGLPASLTS